MTNLVIVESPAKCAKIQGFLGNGYKVIASMGHIRKLKEDLDAVGLDRDFDASWEFMTKEKSKAIAQLKDVAKSASQVYLASDADREGAAIAYAICLLLKLDPATTPRITFQEITQSAIQSAIQNPGLLNLNQVHAAEARAILDMMIGFTMSPLLWKAVGSGLSAGRCQTPALRLCAERETEIENFKSASSWKVHGSWSAAPAATSHVAAEPTVWPAFLTDELEDEENATTYLEIHHTEPHGTVLTAETKPWSESAPLPLITSTLQQQASTLFRSQPKRTMTTAQRLYEAGHITYMRTDKAVLSEEAYKAAQALVTTRYGVEYNKKAEVPATKVTKTTKGKKKEGNEVEKPKAQEAHEAIRPTHFEVVNLPADEDWSVVDRKIYGLIWQRAVQSVMSPVKGDQRTVTFVADGDDQEDFQWRATARKTTFPGWRKASTAAEVAADETQEEDAAVATWTAMNNLEPGQRLQWSTLQADPYETKAPPRYTEASLIRELELKGIGRPSTFASLISTIVDKSYVETKTVEGRQVEVKKLLLSQPRVWPPQEQLTTQKVGTEKDRLVPTELGRTVLHYLLTHFDDLFAYTFTSAMETRLDSIAEGQEPFKQVLRDTWNAYKDRYTTLKAAKSTTGAAVSEHKREFADGLKAVMTKKGPLLLREDPKGIKDNTIFYGWPTAVPFADLTEEAAQAFAASKATEKVGQVLGEHDGHPITKKVGKFGPYVEWNGKTVSISATDTLQQVTEKLSNSAATTGKVVGTFEIRKGPYGLYMFKRTAVGPARKFVGVPDTIDLDTVTEQTLLELFQEGLKAKARGGAFAARKSPAKTDGGEAPSGSTRDRGGYRGGAARGAARGRGRGKKE